jgi:hypothetical protein
MSRFSSWFGAGCRWGFGDAAAGDATVSGMAGGGPANFGGACGVRRPLTLGRLSRLEIEIIECLRGLLRTSEQGHLTALPWSCRFGWHWIISILEHIRNQAPVTARLVSLNRARRGAYNDIDSVNIGDGLVMLQLS